MRNILFKTAYIVFTILIVVSFLNLKNLPKMTGINNELYKEPLQASSTALTEFNFNYKEKDYHVKPIADYELWGLVVSVNNIGAWYNMYHDKNSVNIKDICVIWGDNLKSEAYKQVKYKSGEWTCYYSWFEQLDGQFRGNQLSNNHLFSNNANIRDTIKKMNIGDQVHIKGALSEYKEVGTSQYRGTSLNRNDSGNGACETVFVSEAEIIKKRFPDWKSLYEWSKNLFFLSFIINIFLLLKDARNITKARPSI